MLDEDSLCGLRRLAWPDAAESDTIGDAPHPSVGQSNASSDVRALIVRVALANSDRLAIDSARATWSNRVVCPPPI